MANTSVSKSCPCQGLRAVIHKDWLLLGGITMDKQLTMRICLLLDEGLFSDSEHYKEAYDIQTCNCCELIRIVTFT